MARSSALLCLLLVNWVAGANYNDPADYSNLTDAFALPSVRQLLNFRLEHPKPIGLLTIGSGAPTEIRDTITFNSDLLRSDFFFDRQSHLDGERIPIRVVQAKGTGAWGYFEVTHDVSKYTKADVFNGIGKKTPALARLSVGGTGTAGPDLGNDLKDLAVKLYTKEGNLDFLNLQLNFFAFKDPILFQDFVHAFDRRNVRSNLRDPTMIFDLAVLRPFALAAVLYLFSDLAVPDGFDHTDYFPIHTYELMNEHDDRWYARFNWRTERGRRYLTRDEIRLIRDQDYLTRKLYNNIENGTYPVWRLEMDVMSLKDIQAADYNPFDVTRPLKEGTYKTVPIGRLVLNRTPENQFRDIEMAAFNPANLVPGIPGPVDTLFRGRRFAYKDTQNYRLGRNHLKTGINAPYYAKSYKRDGLPPVLDNGKDSPTYYPNAFNGPVPVVDEDRPKEYLQILESNAVDLQIAADFYEKTLPDDSSRQRLANTLAENLAETVQSLQKRVLRLFSLASPDLAQRVAIALQAANAEAAAISPVYLS
ncbi:catalase domain-containing protein [Phthorimaea operculella]|nr:catalase domain-containing protein [Phthorimaea operculella]